MRGGAQSHLMRCSDGHYYVVKFQNNPQGSRILANELLGSRLAARIGLRVPAIGVVEVRADLISGTGDLSMQMGRGCVPCKAGLQFGSRYPGSPADTAVFDFLPEEQLRATRNLLDFCGVLAFDKWTCNTNGRQAIFYREKDGDCYEACMIDHGFCFNSADWNFPDAPLRGIYPRHCVYEPVRGIASFEPWIARIERIDESVLGEFIGEIPPEWYEWEEESLWRMAEQLLRRRKLVRDLIISAWKSSTQPFRNWT